MRFIGNVVVFYLETVYDIRAWLEALSMEHNNLSIGYANTINDTPLRC
jgi:hypothetical protein